MDKLIPQLYKEYGQYINHSRAFCLNTDGLKPVERRVLLVAYQIARDKFVKSAKIDGATIGSYHPHASTYSTIVQLVNQGFLDGQGNFGNNIGIEPSNAAAMRYTEAKLSKRIYDIALRLIDYVDWVESELDNEPENLPTMLPLCLLGKEYTTGIGFGFKTLIPCYKIEDLIKRLMFVIGELKEAPLIKPITNCKILSSDKEMETLLTTGKATILFQGIHKIHSKNCRVELKNWPPGKRFETILSKFEKELSNQDIGWIDESSSEKGGTNIVFEVLKQRNRDEIFKSFTKKLSDVLTGSVSFEINVVDKDTKNIKSMSVDEMLLNTFKSYLKTNMRMLKENESKLFENINEVKLLDKVKPSLIKHLKNKDLDIQETIELISIDVKEDKIKIKELFQKYKITKLLTFKADYEELNEKIKTIQYNIKNIGNFVVDQYQNI